MTKQILLSITLALGFQALSAQDLPRVFVEIPTISVHAPDLKRTAHLMGADAEAGFNLGTHWSMARIAGGANFSIDPKSKRLDSLTTTPYGLFEIGLGQFRTNGNKCAASNRSAFSAMAKAGVRYNFNTKLYDTPIQKAEALDYTAGVELSYFYIRDIFKNYEVFLDANYHLKSKITSARFGFRLFLNLRADMSRRY